MREVAYTFLSPFRLSRERYLAGEDPGPPWHVVDVATGEEIAILGGGPKHHEMPLPGRPIEGLLQLADGTFEEVSIVSLCIQD